MSDSLPEYYFRIRENGAAVFRVDTANRQRRIEFEEIAAVNVRNGNIRPHGERALTPADLTAIEAWLKDRRALLETREVDDILRAVDHLNLTAQWVQSRASEAQLDAVTDTLLLAMHDLRMVLVRKKAEQLTKGDQAPAGNPEF